MYACMRVRMFVCVCACVCMYVCVREQDGKSGWVGGGCEGVGGDDKRGWFMYFV